MTLLPNLGSFAARFISGSLRDQEHAPPILTTGEGCWMRARLINAAMRALMILLLIRGCRARSPYPH